MSRSLSEAILFGASVEAIKGILNGLPEEERKQAVNAKDTLGDTPLHLASQKKKLYVVMLLVNCGADVNAQNNAGSTPLHKAVLGAAEMVVDHLLEKGAKFTDNNSGFSPLDYARKDRALWTRLSSRVQLVNGTIDVPTQYLAPIIGSKGAGFDMLLAETGTSVNKAKDGTEEVTSLHLTAIKEAHIEAAKKIIEKKISDSKQQVGVIPVAPVKPTDFAAYRERMTVPKEKRGVVFGKGGETLNTLMRTTNTKIYVPPASEKSDQIIIEGDPREVAHAKREITALLKSVQNTGAKMAITKRVEIPKGDAGKVIGKGGETRKELEATYGVIININSDLNNNLPNATIDIKGTSLGLVDACVLAIIDLVEESHKRRDQGRGNAGNGGNAGNRGNRGDGGNGGNAGNAGNGGQRGGARAATTQEPKKPRVQKVATNKLDDLQSWPEIGK